jgi:uncharacterized membrane protein
MQELNDLKKKVQDLDKRVRKLEGNLSMSVHEDDMESKVAKIEAESMRMEAKTAKKSQRMEKPSAFIAWVKDNFLMKLGAFFLFLALAWFVSFAFANNWIGPVGRITLGMGFGLLVMAGGQLTMKRNRTAGQVLMVLGGAVFLVTIYSARNLYDFFTPSIALLAMFAVMVLMAALAIMNNARSVAYCSLLGAAVVPLLVASHNPSEVALLSYIFVVDLGVLLVAAMRGWRGLIALSLVISALYSVAFDGLGEPAVFVAMAVFYGLFFAASLSAILKSKELVKADLFVNVANGVLLLGWILAFVPGHLQSIVTALVALLLCVVTYLVLQVVKYKVPMYLNAALALLFLGAATAMELEGEVLTIAFFLEAVVAVLLAKYLIKETKAVEACSFLMVIPVILSFESLDAYSWANGPLISKAFFVLVIACISLAVTAYLVQKANEEDKVDNAALPLVHIALAALYLAAIVWLGSHNILEEFVARFASLLIYTIVGLAIFFVGVREDRVKMKNTGSIILGFVVLRLFLVEIWDMSLFYRVITFFAVGVLLMTTAFFTKKHE